MIYEPAKSNSRQQREGESVDRYITDLHCPAKVIGLRDRVLLKKLQLDSKLTLEKDKLSLVKVRSRNNKQQ